MRLITIIGLVALTASNLFAQSEVRALPLSYSTMELLSAQDIPAGEAVVSAAFAMPAELVSIEYDVDSATGLGLGTLSVTFSYSDEKDGIYTKATDTTSSNATDTVSFISLAKATAGADIRLYPAQFCKAHFKNDSAVTVSLNRLTALRKGLGLSYRPHALIDEKIDLKLSGTVANAAESSASGTTALPAELVSVFWDSDGGSATRKVNFYYSNSKDGPFVAWEDQGVEAVAFQNSVSASDADAVVTCKPFPALYCQIKWKNETGGSRVLTKVLGVRRAQQKR